MLGLGSIGHRHAANLVWLGCDVTTFDPAGGERAPRGARVVESESEALDAATAAVIASPTVLHAEQARRALERGCHVLVEKPLATDGRTAHELVELAAEVGRVLTVAMNLRFHPGPRGLRHLVAAGRIGRPLTAHFSFGYHLPEWRPETDYRTGYSARRELGGGVLLDVIHELDYAAWILGPLTEVDALLETVSDLEVDVEDVVKLNARHASGAVSSFDLDYLDHKYRRSCRIVGSAGTIEWVWSEEEVRLHRPDGGSEVIQALSDPAAAYRAELEQFLRLIDRRLPETERLLATGEDGADALAVVDAARKSASRGGRARISGRGP